MIVYVVFGGMLATTWVQIVKAVLLMAGTFLLSILVMAHFHFSFSEFFGAISHVPPGSPAVSFPPLRTSAGILASPHPRKSGGYAATDHQ